MINVAVSLQLHYNIAVSLPLASITTANREPLSLQYHYQAILIFGGETMRFWSMQGGYLILGGGAHGSIFLIGDYASDRTLGFEEFHISSI